MNKIKTNQDLDDCFYENTYSYKNQNGSIGFKEKIYVIEDIDCCLDIVKNRNKNTKCKEIKKDDKKKDNEKNNDKDDKDDKDNIDIDSDIDILNSSSDEEGFTKRKKLNRFKKFILNDQSNNDKLSLGHLLNLFDGIRETPGRIIIITTNHVDQIDPALKRPGRIDIHLKMDYINFSTFSEMIYNYYNCKLEKDDLNDNIKNIYDKKITPAEITNILVNSDDKIDFLNNINNKLSSI